MDFDTPEIQIPTPIAPARPLAPLNPIGQTVPITTSSGINGAIDTAGNLWNEAGDYMGNVSSSPAAPATPAASSSTLGAAAKLTQWAAGLVSRSTAPGTGISLEDIVFIVLGLMMMGAALFTFEQTKTVVKNVTDTVKTGAGHIAELAA
jgi:hypothetical protein